jgi:DNA mismatch repair protein MutL
VANGCNTVQFYRATTLEAPPLRAGADVKEQEEAAAFQRALRPVHDHARNRRLPLGIANLLLSGLLVFAATRALGARPGSRPLAEQALAANSAYAIADFALTSGWRREMAQTVATSFPRSALHGREGMTEDQVASMLGVVMNGMFVLALVGVLLVFGLSFLTLRARGTLAYFAAVEEDQEEQESLAVGIVARLPDDLANQIAAGEVVERPASVVKELLENALDAGATRITVEVEGGGITLLRITDNGVGMDAADAALALERHATSKLRAFVDLLSLSSFGFRGEALPSIASVSRFTLRTRQKTADEGVEIVVTAGHASPARPCGMAAGTILEVRDLFFNVPARRKFLKSQATESSHISEVVEAMALGNPQLSIDLVREGRRVNEWLSSNGVGDRVRTAFKGEDLAELSGTRSGVSVHAFLGRPERARAVSHSTRLFVNGRVIRDRALLRSVTQAYGSVLPPGRYPVGVVFLTLPPDQVDVNVHPQKAEVRFARSRDVLDALYEVLSLELGRAFGLAGPQRSFPKAPPRPTFARDVEKPAEGWSWDDAPAALRREAALVDEALPLLALAPRGREPGASPTLPPTTTRSAVSPRPDELLADAVHPAPPSPVRTAQPPVVIEADPWGLSDFDGPPSAASPGTPAVSASSPVYPSLELAPADRDVEGRVRFSSLRYLGQSRATYLLCEGIDALYVLDQHAAAERVTFHRLKTAFAARAVAIQPLLFPRIIEAPETDVAMVDEHHEELLGAGLDARAAGARQIAIHGIPQILKRGDPERMLRDLLAEASRQGGRAFSDAIDLALATMACHGSLRAGDRVAPEEATALLQALDDVDFAGHCPHGRPVVTSLRFDELERKVGRR